MKCRKVMALVNRTDLVIVLLQETKLEDVGIWGSQFKDWHFIPSLWQAFWWPRILDSFPALIFFRSFLCVYPITC